MFLGLLQIRHRDQQLLWSVGGQISIGRLGKLGLFLVNKLDHGIVDAELWKFLLISWLCLRETLRIIDSGIIVKGVVERLHALRARAVRKLD